MKKSRYPREQVQMQNRYQVSISEGYDLTLVGRYVTSSGRGWLPGSEEGRGRVEM